ncbi:methyltransferase family protein [Acidihalobacter ferrooxydans]|uniref:Isoprenylcysteine carboxyl methyltransferase n=1 Tax=Acidihalobacter ferrooxydans TaxID=1765967 RepID=A0A1P8UHN8_9GAMM|nr:isoprenylcysteine carboxylmethyltransferase family protein [Acidihalobacter ferrooxydans]APZ43342.1 hypothetical protein BW247_09760 [Acidihalobacter ferrooxydans]
MIPAANWAGIFIVLTENIIALRFRSFDPDRAHSRAFFDRYIGFGWLLGLGVFFSFFFGILLSKVFQLPGLMPGYAMGIGIFLIVLGYSLRFAAIAALRGGFSVVLRVESGQRVVTSGPYRYVRHPSYTGALLAMQGLGVLSAYPAVLLLLFLTSFTLFWIRIQREESLLVAHLPGYAEYCVQTTYRLIPGLL